MRRGRVRSAAFSLAFLTVIVSTTDVGAQQPVQPLESGRTGQAQVPERRLELELQLRRGLWRVAKRRIGFSEQQMQRLELASQRFDQRRRALAEEERTLRRVLREEIIADSASNQERIGSSLDRLLQLHRQRAELLAEEQKEFSTFMTPLQRAKFLSLQDQLRRRMEMLRRDRSSPMGRAWR